MLRTSAAAAAFAMMFSAPALSQEASFVHRLGRDTIAIEQYTRTGNRIVGEVVSRGATAVNRLQYEATLDKNGHPVSAIYRMRSAAGAPLPNGPTEVRVTFVGDSVKREAVFADSTSTRMLPAVAGTPFQGPAYGLWEVAFAQLRKNKAKTMSFAIVNSGTGVPQVVTLTAAGGDTIVSSSGPVFRADPQGRLLALDMTSTTQKLVSARAPGGLDLAALASRLRPLGTLSSRGNATASFFRSTVFVDYGRPSVRGRTVWGGVLIPFDTIWRAGANEATHLAASRELTFGNLVVPAGLYTLWIYNSRNDGPQLVINKKIGGWGAGSGSYEQSQDLGRVAMSFSNTPEHVEEFTITIRPVGPGRGAIDFAWGDKVATAAFTVRQ
jgi:hypothetical protein